MEIKLLPITEATASRGAEGVLSGSEPSEVAALVGQVADAQLALYRRTGATAPWIGYFAREATSREVLGSCSFVGPPQEGCVEIAYFTFPHAEGRGVAKQMAAMLLSIARTNAEASTVIAHTLPEENSSTRVLKSLGFAVIGSAIDDEAGCVWKWQLPLRK